MNGRIVIVPSESTALAKLEWVADSETLHVTYSSNEERIYACEGVDWGDLRELLDAVSVHGSWGSALHHWKENRAERLAVQDEVIVSTILQSLDTRTQLRLLDRLATDLGADGKRVRLDQFVRRQ